jgi:uncharacterized protein (DUF433 family)
MDIITQNPNVMSGAPCFAGTRVPVATLFDNLNDGATLNQFVEWFPGVTLEQVKAVLQQASNDMLKRAA